MRRHPLAPANVVGISVATSGTDFTAPGTDFAAGHPGEGSAASADARNLAVEQLVLLPDGRSGRRGTGSGCRKSRSSHLDGSLHRERSVCSRRRGYGRYGNRAYRRRRYRRHSGRIADAAGIADRAVESSGIRRSRRNAAYAGILGRRSRRRGQKTQHRNGQQCRSAGHPSAREDRNKLRAFHQPAILSRLVIVHGEELENGAEVPMVRHVEPTGDTFSRQPPENLPFMTSARSCAQPSVTGASATSTNIDLD